MGRNITRRSMLALGLTSAIAMPMINLGSFTLFARQRAPYSRRTLDLIADSLVIDGLAWPSHPRRHFDEWTRDPRSISDEYVGKIRSSGIDVFHFSVIADSFEEGFRNFAHANSLIAGRGDLFRRIDTIASMDATKREGRAGLLLGTQDAVHFRSVGDIPTFYALGQRVAQLTYNEQNLLGTGATERNGDSGITDYGVAVVAEMNRIGMTVDTSHCGDRTTLDAIAASQKPILISHACCRALNDHPRNKTDEAIRALAAKGGVMGIANTRMFVRDREPTTIDHVIAHYDHVKRIAGIEHVAIGADADLDGYDAYPPEMLRALKATFSARYGFRERIDIEGLDHPRRTFDLVEAFVRHGYSDQDIRLILGGNLRRVLAETWSR